MQRGPTLYDPRQLFAPDGAHRRVLLLLDDWGELSIEGVALRQRLSYPFTHTIVDRGVTVGLIRLRTEAGLYSLSPRGLQFLANGGDHETESTDCDPHPQAVA